LSLKMDALAIFRTRRVARPRPPERRSCTGLRIRFNDRDVEDATNCSRPQDGVCLRTRSWHSGEPALTLVAGIRTRGAAGPRCFHGLSLRAVSPAPTNRRTTQPASLWDTLPFSTVKPSQLHYWPGMCFSLATRKQFAFGGTVSPLTRRLGGQCRTAQALSNVEQNMRLATKL
jgi:hypothetical protein